MVVNCEAQSVLYCKEQVIFWPLAVAFQFVVDKIMHDKKNKKQKLTMLCSV